MVKWIVTYFIVGISYNSTTFIYIEVVEWGLFEYRYTFSIYHISHCHAGFIMCGWWGGYIYVYYRYHMIEVIFIWFNISTNNQQSKTEQTYD